MCDHDPPILTGECWTPFVRGIRSPVTSVRYIVLPSSHEHRPRPPDPAPRHSVSKPTNEPTKIYLEMVGTWTLCELAPSVVGREEWINVCRGVQTTPVVSNRPTTGSGTGTGEVRRWETERRGSGRRYGGCRGPFPGDRTRPEVRKSPPNLGGNRKRLEGPVTVPITSISPSGIGFPGLVLPALAERPDFTFRTTLPSPPFRSTRSRPVTGTTDTSFYARKSDDVCGRD